MATKQVRHLQGTQLVSDVRSLSMGTPASALANAATRGRISDINSGVEVRQARELNAAFAAITQQMRAFSNEMKLNNARGYQTGQAPAGNAAGIRRPVAQYGHTGVGPG